MTTVEDAVCRFCGWEGDRPVRDAHGSLFCPVCGRPAEYKVVLEALKRRGLWKA